jgi:hypothetical protein
MSAPVARSKGPWPCRPALDDGAGRSIDLCGDIDLRSRLEIRVGGASARVIDNRGPGPPPLRHGLDAVATAPGCRVQQAAARGNVVQRWREQAREKDSVETREVSRLQGRLTSQTDLGRIRPIRRPGEATPSSTTIPGLGNDHQPIILHVRRQIRRIA